ncbi:MULTISPECIES: hypothetical protein [Stenotrophomonas]|jgi:hypothetical protein|nr:MULTISPECIES: hypothetical protein [Stenotrophomonas]
MIVFDPHHRIDLTGLRAGVPEPALMDRVLQLLAGEIPDGVRCGMP